MSTGQEPIVEPRLADELGPDLAALVAELEPQVVDALPITTLPARALTRATFRLTLADGRVLKGRRLDAASDAERIRSIVRRLDRPEMPRVLAQRGAALLEEWIPGEPLGQTVLEPGFLTACGRILGAIHATPVHPPPSSSVADTGSALARTERTIGTIVRDGIVPAAVAADLVAIVRAHRPAAMAIGFVHRDFCGENIVRGSSGAPVVVDSGNVGIDAYDHDLARTWYRWPLGPADRAAFEAGYCVHRDPGDRSTHFPFWAVTVLADALLFRVRARTPGWRVPLRRLEALLHDLGRGHAHQH